MNVTMASDA